MDYSSKKSSYLGAPRSKEFLGVGKKDLDFLKNQSDIHENWGIEGLLGQFLFNRYLKSPNNKWDLDLGNSQLNYRPTKRLSFFARPDSLEDNKPSGLKIGGEFKF